MLNLEASFFPNEDQIFLSSYKSALLATKNFKISADECQDICLTQFSKNRRARTNIFKRLGIIDGIDKNHGYGSLVVGLVDILESLLPSSIPYLEFDFAILNRDDFDFKINSNCGGIAGFKLIITKSEKNVSFAHSAVTDNHHLNRVIGIIFFLVCFHLLQIKFLSAIFESLYFLAAILHNQLLMNKRKNNQYNKVRIKAEEDLSHEEDDFDDQSPSTRKGKGRHQNSLSVLTKKFVSLIKNSEEGMIDLNEAMQTLNVQKRRIYDITNVLEGIGYVEKIQKNIIKWVGGSGDPSIEKDIKEAMGKLNQYTEEQAKLDAEINRLNKKIKEEYLQNESLREYQYITYEDCENICKSMAKDSTVKSIVVVSAPKGTTLETVDVDEQGHCQLVMDANKKGQIKIYTCDTEKGVTEYTKN